MIKVVKEIELADFPFWSGAINVAKFINEQNNSDECWLVLESIICDDIVSATYVNDYIWFDAIDILTEYGMIDQEE